MQACSLPVAAPARLQILQAHTYGLLNIRFVGVVSVVLVLLALRCPVLPCVHFVCSGRAELLVMRATTVTPHSAKPPLLQY